MDWRMEDGGWIEARVGARVEAWIRGPIRESTEIASENPFDVPHWGAPVVAHRYTHLRSLFTENSEDRKLVLLTCLVDLSC